MPGILIADAGSTKTDWAFIDKKSRQCADFSTCGINPLTMDYDYIFNEFNTLRQQLGGAEIEKIYFYGAGCIDKKQEEKISQSLQKVFPASSMHIDSDIIGAGIALFGLNKGIACILGTGSNAAMIENGKVVKKIPALGYILGDEGSGAALGKRLVNSIYKERLPLDIRKSFEKHFGVTLSDIIERVYRGNAPSAYLASFAPFVLENITIAGIHRLATQEFESFLQTNVIPLCKNNNEVTIGITGSIGIHFSPIIIEVATKLNLPTIGFLDKPIDGLKNFYLQNTP